MARSLSPASKPAAFSLTRSPSRVADGAFRGLTIGAAASILAVLAALFVLLVIDALPAIRRYGPSFITTST
jgi:ABC-type phosphate transport system permease subunit